MLDLIPFLISRMKTDYLVLLLFLGMYGINALAYLIRP